MNTEERSTIVYEQNALVLFQGSSDPVKKQRAKVDLDE